MSGSGAEFTEMTGKVIKDAARLAKDVGKGTDPKTSKDQRI